MGKGKVLRIYDTQAVFENLDGPVSSSLLVTQSKDNGMREFQIVKSKEQLTDLGSTAQILPFEAIFGFYDLLSGSYVALVVESEPFFQLNFMNMRKAKKVLTVPLFRHGRPLSESKQADEDRYLKLLNLGFSEHSFFFSYNSDITVTQQRLAKISSKQLTNDPVWSRADLRFFWNRDLVEDLVVVHADEWIVPFMSAFVEVAYDVPIEDQSVNIVMISRRSRFRQGCRFVKRGIDENGQVANFAEAEQILVFPDGRITSFVQIRGSIPVKWMSPVHMKYAPVVYIDGDHAKSQEYAIKHFTELTEKYSDNNGHATILMINLVDCKKEQGKLGSAYESTVAAVSSQVAATLVLEWFDFHDETKKKGKWNNLSKLVMKVQSTFQELKFFSRAANGQVTSWQKGVIRTNCMDNLDRTNVVQSLFARRSLVLQAGLTKVEMSGAHILQTPYKQFETIFKSMWTNNANAMSMGYTGTGALKADFTKTGKRTIKGMFNDGVNSCMRYYINNFTDGVKQDAIDLLIGRYRPDPHGRSPFTQKSSQETLSNNFTKAFVLVVIIFTTLMLFVPPMKPFSTFSGVDDEVDILEKNLRHLQMHFALSLIIAFVILAYMAYKIVKKGSKVGELMVLHPELCREPLPTGAAAPARN